jgi:hypothetical protein
MRVAITALSGAVAATADGVDSIVGFAVRGLRGSRRELKVDTQPLLRPSPETTLLHATSNSPRGPATRGLAT